jgi:hypothetical protein
MEITISGSNRSEAASREALITACSSSSRRQKQSLISSPSQESKIGKGSGPILASPIVRRSRSHLRRLLNLYHLTGLWSAEAPVDGRDGAGFISESARCGKPSRLAPRPGKTRPDRVQGSPGYIAAQHLSPGPYGRNTPYSVKTGQPNLNRTMGMFCLHEARPMKVSRHLGPLQVLRNNLESTCPR